MGLFDWVKPKKQIYGPTSEGLYAGIPQGAHWTLGPDPAGDPKRFLPDSNAYIFDIVEWRWDKALWIEASTNSDGVPAGFGLVLGISEGNTRDRVEIWEDGGRRGPIVKETQEWIIPHGHPTRELALFSQGERTTNVLRRLEKCFGCQPFAHPAVPDKTAIICELLMLRGIVNPNDNRFTARMKVVLPSESDQLYGEFHLHINSVLKLIWLTEKSDEYRNAILSHISDFSGG